MEIFGEYLKYTAPNYLEAGHMTPRIFISSTIYDFRDLRSCLKFYFERYGYQVQLSEFNDFRKKLDLSSYDACFDSIQSSDYFILLIGARVGGFFNKTDKIMFKVPKKNTRYG